MMRRRRRGQALRLASAGGSQPLAVRPSAGGGSWRSVVRNTDIPTGLVRAAWERRAASTYERHENSVNVWAPTRRACLVGAPEDGESFHSVSTHVRSALRRLPRAEPRYTAPRLPQRGVAATGCSGGSEAVEEALAHLDEHQIGRDHRDQHGEVAQGQCLEAEHGGERRAG